MHHAETRWCDDVLRRWQAGPDPLRPARVRPACRTKGRGRCDGTTRLGRILHLHFTATLRHMAGDSNSHLPCPSPVRGNIFPAPDFP